MKPTLIFICTFWLSTAIADPEMGNDKNRAWIDAPKERIGVRIEDWIEYLGSDYTIGEPSAFKKRQTGEPMAVLWLTDGSTEARFMVNLITNEHHLIVVQSKSETFLQEMGIDQVPIEKGSETRLTDGFSDDGDAGQDELNIQRTSGGRLAAIWIYLIRSSFRLE